MIDQQSSSVLMRVWLLGPFLVERRHEHGTWEAINTWDKYPYARLLLKRLLCSGERKVQRSTIIDDLWPHPDTPERYPSDAAYHLRKVLHIPNVLKTFGTNSGYQLVDQSLLWVDVDACTALLTEAERIGRTSAAALRLLEQASEHFQRGGFLEGQAGEWCHARRATVERMWYRCHLWLADAYEQQGLVGQAEMQYSRLLEEDPTDEDALCLLIGLLYRHGLTQQALRCYEETKKQIKQIGLQLSSATTAFAERLRSEPRQTAWYLAPETRQPLLCDSEEQQIQRAMTMITRREFLQAGVAATASSISIFAGKHVTEEQRSQLHHALSENIKAGWKLFHTAGNAQALAVGQAQLFLVQQTHTLLYPSVRSFLYAGAYSLIGIALHFQEHDEEALQVHSSAYIAALATGEPWYVVQSLICQADCHHALGQYGLAIQTIEEALRIIGHPTDEAQVRAKAHLLTCWADNALVLGDYTTAQKKLDAAAEYLDRLTPNEEFDRAGWLLLAGKHALITKRYAKAIDYFEEALAELPDQWIWRRAATIIGLSMAYARMKERDQSLAVAENLMPMIQTANARMTDRWFTEYLQRDLLGVFPMDDYVRTFVTDSYRRRPQLAGISSTGKRE